MLVLSAIVCKRSRTCSVEDLVGQSVKASIALGTIVSLAGENCYSAFAVLE